MSEQQFPSRVTLGEDGVYRWSYDMDMYRNHFLRNFLLKLLGAIFGAALLFFLLMISGDSRFGLSGLLWSLGVYAAVMLLAVAIYYIAAACMHGVYRLRYEMGEDAVMLVRKPSADQMYSNLALLAQVAGAVAGKSSEGARVSGAMHSAAQAGLTYFSNVHGVGEHPKWDALNLREFLSANQIWVGPEDYAFVRDYILERVPDKAKKPGRIAKRVKRACFLSLIVNFTAYVINQIGFRQTSWLPLAITYSGGAEQRAFLLRAYHYAEARHVLNQDAGLGLIGFLVVAAAFYLLLSLFAWAIKGTRGE